MILQPRRQKYRRTFRGDITKVASNGYTLSFGDYGLKAMDSGLMTARQIEAARKTITHYTKRGGKIWIRIFPYMPMTKKADGVKLGSGKGNVYGFGTPIKAGSVLFEIVGVSEEVAKEAFRLASHKIPLKVKFIRMEDQF